MDFLFLSLTGSRNCDTLYLLVGEQTPQQTERGFMTTTAEQSEQDKATAIKTRNADMAAREVTLNAGKTGKGLRSFLGMTRGRNPQEIQYENWDEAQPDSLPLTLSEFMDLRKLTDEKDIIHRLILGDNDVLYAEASDPVAEFVDASWDVDVQKQFRIVVRNYSNATGVSIEDAVALIKPGIVASQSKR
jgi:hypothetical protein